MANYNADLRIGITGKTQLNALEKQLGRINKDLNQINKNLKAQTLTINTKGATRALDQLDRKINKLNRTINVNANINERRSKSGGGGNLFVSGGGVDPKQVALARAVVAPAKALTDETQKQLDLEAEKQRQVDRLKKGQQDILDNQKGINKLEDQRAKLQKSANNRSAAAMFGAGTTRQQGLDKVNAKLKNSTDLLKVQNKVQESIVKDTVAASKAAGQYNAQLRDGKKLLAEQNQKLANRKQFNKGAQAGGGLIAASAASGIPLVGDAVTGGLAASFLPGATKSTVAGGAVAGLAVAAAAALGEFGAQAVKTATQVNKLRISLELAAGTDFERSLETINTVVNDFNTPLDQATTSFTKLYASAQGSGIAFNDLSELFINLSAANKAFAGDAEDLNGILRAFTQIISKGTVQSEELKGQVGERLPGAFAMAAKALGMTTSELQKALENGDVKSKEFVEKFGRYMRRFRKDAEIIADAPEEAGARLTVALQNLQVDTGKELARLGAQFQNFATQAIKELTRLYNFLGQLGADLENRINQLGGNPTQNLEGYVKGVKTANEAIQKIQEDILDPSRSAEDAKNDQRNLDIWYQSRKDFQAKIDALKMGPPVPTAPPAADVKDELKKTKSGSGSKSGPRDTTAELQAAIAAQRVLLDIEKQRFGLTGRELELRSFADDKRAREAELARELSDIQRDNITAASKKLAIEYAELQAATDLQQILNEEQLYRTAINEEINAQLTDLETQIKIEEAITDKLKEQVKLEARIAEIKNGPGSEEQKAELIAAEQRLQRAREGNQGISGYMKQLQRELMDTEGMIVELAGVVENELGNAMTRTVTGLIDGTTTMQEAFANAFKAIGNAFISMAMRMIAKALVLKALGVLFPGADAAAGSGMYGSGSESPLTKGLDFSSAFKAKGGPINAGMPYIVGEQGPELVIPGAAGTVIPNDAFSAATQALQSNGRGTAAGVDGTASQGEAFAVANGARSISTETSRNTSTMNMIREYEERVINNPTPLKVDYQSTVINSQTYVTEEQFQKGLTQSSNRARQATIRDLRNNPASRKMAGVNR